MVRSSTALAVDGHVVATGVARERYVEGPAPRRPAPARGPPVDDGRLHVVHAHAQHGLEDLGPAHGHRPDLATESSGVAGREPRLVIEHDLAEGAVEHDLRSHRRHCGLGEDRPRRVHPARSGHGVVVEEADHRTPGMAQAEVHPAGEPDVDGRAHHLGAERRRHLRRLVPRRAVVDHHHLVGLVQGRGDARCEPVPGPVRHDDHRRVRWHQRVATTFP